MEARTSCSFEPSLVAAVILRRPEATMTIVAVDGLTPSLSATSAVVKFLCGSSLDCILRYAKTRRLIDAGSGIKSFPFVRAERTAWWIHGKAYEENATPRVGSKRVAARNKAALPSEISSAMSTPPQAA